MTTRHKGIIAYGTEEDRKRLAVLSKVTGLSASEYLITMIRDHYEGAFGDADPNIILTNQLGQ